MLDELKVLVWIVWGNRDSGCDLPEHFVKKIQFDVQSFPWRLEADHQNFLLWFWTKWCNAEKRPWRREKKLRKSSWREERSKSREHRWKKRIFKWTDASDTRAQEEPLVPSPTVLEPLWARGSEWQRSGADASSTHPSNAALRPDRDQEGRPGARETRKRQNM